LYQIQKPIKTMGLRFWCWSICCDWDHGHDLIWQWWRNRYFIILSQGDDNPREKLGQLFW